MWDLRRNINLDDYLNIAVKSVLGENSRSVIKLFKLRFLRCH